MKASDSAMICTELTATFGVAQLILSGEMHRLRTAQLTCAVANAGALGLSPR